MAISLAKTTTTWRPKEGERVAIKAGGQVRGEVCTAARGMFPNFATVAVTSGDKLFLDGVIRPFTLRRDGTWIMQFCKMAPGSPRLERIT